MGVWGVVIVVCVCVGVRGVVLCRCVCVCVCDLLIFLPVAYAIPRCPALPEAERRCRVNPIPYTSHPIP